MYMYMYTYTYMYMYMYKYTYTYRYMYMYLYMYMYMYINIIYPQLQGLDTNLWLFKPWLRHTHLCKDSRSNLQHQNATWIGIGRES